MISFALMLMTLPSRMAEVRVGRADRAGRADQARAGASSTAQAVRSELPNSSREGGGCSSVRLDNTSSAARDNASPARTGRYNKER
jgi:hypothetical protein